MATVLHDSDMYGTVEKTIQNENNAIFLARVSRDSQAKIHLAGCLLDKATILISLDMVNGQVNELIQEAGPLIIQNTRQYDEERYRFLCVAAMSLARLDDSEYAEQYLAEATRIADRARFSDLEYIDHLVDQSAWIYRAMEKYDKAADVLKEAIALCAQHADEKRYYHVMISTWMFLDEIYEDAGETELSEQAANEVRKLIRESPWPIAEDDPIFMR